jgi:hypothetical protein
MRFAAWRNSLISISRLGALGCAPLGLPITTAATVLALLGKGRRREEGSRHEGGRERHY